MNVAVFADSIPQLGTLPKTDQIRVFALFRTLHGGRRDFATADITECFDQCHIPRPSNTSRSLRDLATQSPPELLQSGQRFRLTREALDRLKTRFLVAVRQQTIDVHEILNALPPRLHSQDEGEYLREAIICFRAGAFRGAMLMTWNVAFAHLCEYIIRARLNEFNGAILSAVGKKKIVAVACRDDFQDFKESEILKICRTAAITSKSVDKVLEEKLTRRNLYAHPSGVSVTQLQAEEFIVDLICNGVEKL